VPDEHLAAVVRLACHDLRTPLATISGFAKTMVRAGELPEREARFAGMIDEAADQMNAMIARLALAAAIVSGRYEPTLAEVDTLELAVGAGGRGETIETDADVVGGALAGLAAAAQRHGQIQAVSWEVEGRQLTLTPVAPAAASVLDGSSAKDLGALVGRLAIERLGGSVAVAGDRLLVNL
jgi:light-regulated signal transduction histidine kinase (bacteriophytochrome)